MISIHVGKQHDGFTFALSPQDQHHRKVRQPNRVFLGQDHRLEDDEGPESIASRWLIIASMLTGLTEGDVEQEGFEVVNMPSGEVVPVPEGTEFLRS